jgi:hypothetical protein
MSSQPTLALDRVLRVLRPLVRLLLKSGVTYPVLAAALKRVFLQAAQDELTARRMPSTDSAVSLLSGVHRRDVRTLKSSAPDPAAPPPTLGMAAQVVAHWMHEPLFVDAQGKPRALSRGTADGGSGFDSLVAQVSSDVRPRAVLDELLRLGVVREQPDGSVLLADSGFAPRGGFQEMSWLMAANLQDHAAAAVANLQGEGEFLEQALFVDRLAPESAHRLHVAAAQAWQQAFRSLMPTAQQLFDADQQRLPPDAPRHRARIGIYFYSEPEDKTP